MQSIFSTYDSFPAAAQEALIDMAFNLGKTTISTFTDLIKTYKKEDWATAATESHRKDVPDDRNDEIRELFEGLVVPSTMSRIDDPSARVAAPFKSTVSCLADAVDAGAAASRAYSSRAVSNSSM